MTLSNLTVWLRGLAILSTKHRNVMPKNPEFPNILNNSGQTNAVKPLTTTEIQDLQRIERISRKLSRMSKDCILRTKSRRSPIKEKALGNLPVRSIGDSFLQPRLSNTMANCAYPRKVYGMLYIVPSIQCKIDKLTSKSSTKLTTNLWLCRLYFLKKNSNKQSQSAVTLWLQVQINSCGDISSSSPNKTSVYPT